MDAFTVPNLSDLSTHITIFFREGRIFLFFFFMSVLFGVIIREFVVLYFTGQSKNEM